MKKFIALLLGLSLVVTACASTIQNTAQLWFDYQNIQNYDLTYNHGHWDRDLGSDKKLITSLYTVSSDEWSEDFVWNVVMYEITTETSENWFSKDKRLNESTNPKLITVTIIQKGKWHNNRCDGWGNTVVYLFEDEKWKIVGNVDHGYQGSNDQHSIVDLSRVTTFDSPSPSELLLDLYAEAGFTAEEAQKMLPSWCGFNFGLN